MLHNQTNLSISLLGSFRCQIDDNDIGPDFRTKKERALLAYLAVETNRQHRRDMLGEMFWPEKPEGYARMNLRQAFWGIRRAMQLPSDQLTFLQITDNFVTLKTDINVQVDTNIFNQLFDSTVTHSHQSIETCPTCIQALEKIVSLYQGEFMEGFLVSNTQEFQEWMLFQREHFFRRLLTALHVLIKHYQDTGDIKRALDFAYRQANLAPLEESAQRQLMMLLALDGRRSAAMEQYQNCCQILADELDVSPDLETTALYEKIKAGLIYYEHRPITRPNNTNLPVQFTKFIGREKELNWVLQTIKDPANRLFTITGISGVGKTRLAIQSASRLLDDFSDGVWFIPLNAIFNVDLIPREIASILDIELGESDPRRVVIQALQTKNALLIVDNFEHLLDGTTFLLEILQAAPGINIIITSQRRLSYQAAHTLDLVGLPYPQENDPNWQKYDSVELLITRAKHSRPGLQISDQDAANLIKICNAVNGLPLGLELAATGLRFYSFEHIAKEIQHNIDILQTTMMDIPERHRSIRAAFEQSWSMLSDREQDAYRRLSVFQGEFTLDEAVATTGASPAIIADLVDRSLIQRNTSGYYLIQPILRHYAAEKLDGIFDQDRSDLAFYGNESVSLTRDPLTKLPNKVLFRDLFKQSLAIANRRSYFVALLVIEVNEIADLHKNLKLDEYNSILKKIANVLTSSVRESDIVAHLLPGKFAILLENIAKYQDGELVTKKIQDNFERAYVVSSDGSEITLNMGISIFPNDSEDIAELLHFANIALNKARMANESYRYYSYKELSLFSVKL